ncbi:MAG: alpha/beta fold hydrolase [Vicinamibacterales bacterium]
MIRELSADIGSRTVHYVEAGSGWPLVLLHAFPLSADMWRPQLEQVPEGWRVLAPNLRGFGPGASDAARTLSDMAEDVVGLLDALRIERAAIGGLSMGGYVTLALYRIAPERFSAMVLANTRAGADSAEGRAARDAMSALVREKGPEAVADQMLPKLLGRTSHESRPRLEPLVRAMIRANRTGGIDGAIQAMKNRPDATPLLATVGRPALVISGEEDVLIPLADSAEMDRLLPRSQLVTIPHAGHLSNLEAPDNFNEALGNFLRANI